MSVSKTGLITSVTRRCKAFLSGSPGEFFFAGHHFPQLLCFLVRCSQITHMSFSHLVCIVDILSNCSPILSLNFLYGFGGKTPSTTYSFCDISIVKKRFLLELRNFVHQVPTHSVLLVATALTLGNVNIIDCNIFMFIPPPPPKKKKKKV